jgi:hypothetical protein
MTSLVSLEQVAVRLKLGDTIPDGVESLLTQLMDETTYLLERLLRTSFVRQTHTDVYLLDPFKDKPFVGDNPGIRLKQGFVDSAAVSPEFPFEVRTALSIPDLATVTPIDTDYVVAEYDKGTVMLLASGYVGVPERKLWPANYDNTYASVKYTAGFNESGGVYTDVPGWLQSIALNVVRDVYNSEQDCKSKKGCAMTCAQALSKYTFMAEEHIRFYPWAYDPIL